MLINLTNHTSKSWSTEQMNDAISRWGVVSDLPFPSVDPHADTVDVYTLALEYVRQCYDILNNNKTDEDAVHEDAIHIMGEVSFVLAFVQLWDRSRGDLVVSTTFRDTVDLGHGKKEFRFNFVRFRYV